jgi:hypothetical protein
VGEHSVSIIYSREIRFFHMGKIGTVYYRAGHMI